MATNYPGSLDTSTEQPSPNATTDLDGAGYEHDVVHTNHSGAIIAIETKLGATASNAVADSLLQGTGASTSEWKAAPTISGTLTAGGLAGPLTGDVTGDLTGDVLTASQTAITSVGTLTGLTMGGALALVDNTLTRPELTDYSETVTTIASSTVSADLDLESGNVFEVTLDNSPTLTFSNPPATGKGGSFSVLLAQDATGTRIVTWPGSVKWAGGTTPTLTTTPSRVDIFTFVTTDAGTIWYGFTSGQDFS